jgi:hypothetical protein
MDRASPRKNKPQPPRKKTPHLMEGGTDIGQLGVSFHSEDLRSQNAADEGGFSDSSAADEFFAVAGRNGK